MTIITAFSLKGCHALLGDALITGPIEDTFNGYLTPAFREEEDPYGQSGWGIRGLQQKVVLINDYCSISWAGTEIIARAIISELKAHSRNHVIHLDDIEKLVDQLSLSEREEIQLIACVIENDRANLWGYGVKKISSKYFDTVYVGGSGSESLKMFLDQFESLNILEPRLDEISAFLASTCATILTNFLNDERNIQYKGSPILEGFGGIYEVAVTESGKIKKIPETTSVYFDAHLDENQIFQVSMPKLIIKQKFENDVLLVRSMVTKEDGEGQITVSQDRSYKIFDSKISKFEDYEANNTYLSLISRFLCTSITIHPFDGLIRTPAMVNIYRDNFQAISDGIMLLRIENILIYQCGAAYEKQLTELILGSTSAQ
jgi:hypothetical protein